MSRYVKRGPYTLYRYGLCAFCKVNHVDYCEGYDKWLAEILEMKSKKDEEFNNDTITKDK